MCMVASSNPVCIEAHSAIEKGRNLRFVERGIKGWHKNKRRQDRDGSLHCEAVKLCEMEVLCRPL